MIQDGPTTNAVNIVIKKNCLDKCVFEIFKKKKRHN